MRLSFHRAALAACLVSATCAASALGQGAPASRPANTPTPSAPTGTNVAVIDIALIFKHHDRFNAAMGDIKKDIEQFEALIRDEQKKLKARVDELQAFNPGTTDFQKREAEVARLDSELKVTIGQKRREFLEQEARVYYRVYKEVEQSVGVFAQRFRIGLVLRYNSDDMKEDDRASVLQGVNRAVVWHGNLDITPQIITELNRRPFNPDDVNRSATPGTPGTAGPATTGAAAGGQGRIASPPIIPGQGTKSR